MATVDFQQILAAARQLSKSSQAKLVSALLQEPEAAHTPALEPLTGLSEAELDALLEESDRIALVKAKANYTLSLLKA